MVWVGRDLEMVKNRKKNQNKTKKETVTKILLRFTFSASRNLMRT